MMKPTRLWPLNRLRPSNVFGEKRDLPSRCRKTAGLPGCRCLADRLSSSRQSDP